LVELGLPELTTTQIETLCEIAENAAREHMPTKLGSKRIDRFALIVEAQGTKPVDLSVEINLDLNKDAKNVDATVIVQEAVTQAHLASENFLRTLL
jgi:CRISPR/Cas system-associated exonuclease Cas4 (RecB family)